MLIQTIFIDKENSSKYKNAVLAWLESDFIKKENPGEHFWHNRETIGKAFDDCEAMVALNANKEVVGYSIWAVYGIAAEIDIIEVREDHRKQGIFKQMLKDFTDKFADVHLLTASVLEQSEEIFSHSGWKAYDTDYQKKYFKIVRPQAKQLDALPDGRAIAVFSKVDAAGSKRHVDFYQVKSNPASYNMKYFQIELDENGKLHVPVVTNFDYEGYIGVYFNRELIAEGKAKHLFVDGKCHRDFLVLDKIDPRQPEIFYTKGFLPNPAPQPQLEADIIATEPPRKRQRLELESEALAPIPVSTPMPEVLKFSSTMGTQGLFGNYTVAKDAELPSSQFFLSDTKEEFENFMRLLQSSSNSGSDMIRKKQRDSSAVSESDTEESPPSPR